MTILKAGVNGPVVTVDLEIVPGTDTELVSLVVWIGRVIIVPYPVVSILLKPQIVARMNVQVSGIK